MRFNQMLLLLPATCILLFSCKKEESLEPGNGNASGKLQGTWDFVAMSAYTNSTATSNIGNDIEKRVLITDYETINNGGSITISGNKLLATDFTYTADSEIQAESYLNGVLEDAFTLPFQFTAPPASSVTAFQLIGKDSIHFEQSFIMAPDGTSSGMGSSVSGGKYSFSGDTLVLTASRYVAYTANDAGTEEKMVDFAKVVTKYKKR